MNTLTSTPSQVTASYTYENWQRANLGEHSQEITEATLFTDAWITGEIPKLGPFAFLNTLAQFGQTERGLRPAIVMRMAHHYVPQTSAQPYVPMENNFNHYHGGDYLDETAALVSLFLGRRMKAGGVNREFRGDDRFGQPRQIGSKPDPHLPREGRPQIPKLAEISNLNDGLEALKSFPNRSASQTNTLIKAARQYQQAIWIADSDPSLAWIMLVSAIETAALERSSVGTPVEQLELALPDLLQVIRKSKDPDLLIPVADMLKHITGSTKRFVGFMQTFVPSPPTDRPELYMQFSFAPSDFKKAMSIIYGHRSKSLHEGTAFPLPMCEAPQYTKANNVITQVQEKPLGLAMSSRNASWKIDKTPMLLNTFEYIARGALLNWWKSLDQSPCTNP